MKLDTKKPLTIGARRTLKTLYDTMEQLLKTKNFDQVQVREICEHSMIPRATFYNYFEDKYDLLNYSFTTAMTPVFEAGFEAAAGGGGYMAIIDTLFDNAEQHKEALAKILRKNPPGNTLTNLYEQFFRQEVYRYIYRSGVYEGSEIPQELLAKITADMILDVYEWVYIMGHETPREEIERYIEKMLIQ